MHPLRKSRASDVQIFSIILIFHNRNYFFILSDSANGQRNFDGLGIIHKKEATMPLHTQFGDVTRDIIIIVPTEVYFFLDVNFS